MIEPQNVTDTNKTNKDPHFGLKAGLFLTSVAGMAACAGFGRTLMTVKKKDPLMFDKGMVGSIHLHETGAQLALRALGWGTLYAFVGTGLFCYGIWKLSGAKNLEGFRSKAGSILPKLRKNDPPQSRTEFESLTDFMKYASTWDNEPK